MASAAPCCAGVLAGPAPQGCKSTGRKNRVSSQASLVIRVLSGHGVQGIFHQLNRRTKRPVQMTTHPLLHVLATFTVEPHTKTFPTFLPPEVEFLRDQSARDMAYKIQRVPVQTSLSQQPIMTSSVFPSVQRTDSTPLLLLHGFDSSVLEWRSLYPLLEDGGVECWALDILGWGFNQTDGVSSFGVPAKREHLFEFWKAYIKKPMILVGASLGGSVAIDFAVAHPDAVSKLVLIDAQAFAEGVGNIATFPKLLAYAGISILKSVPLRIYANYLVFRQITLEAMVDSMWVGRLHTLMPGWADTSVNFMLSGGYNVASIIPKVQQESLVIWGEHDNILPKEDPERFKQELPRSQLEYVSDCGHFPHQEKPLAVAQLIFQFIYTE